MYQVSTFFRLSITFLPLFLNFQLRAQNLCPSWRAINNDILVFEGKKERIIGLYAGFKTECGETINSNFSKLIDNLESTMNTEKSVVVVGDFNTDLSKSTFKSKRIDQWQCEYGFAQLVKDITRERLVENTIQRSILDLVFVNDQELYSVRTVLSECSDHHLVIIKAKYKKVPTEINNQKQIATDWRRFNEEALIEGLCLECEKINWDGLTNTNWVNRELTTCITLVLNKLAPRRVVHQRRTTDIINCNVEALKKKRDRLIKKARAKNSVELMKGVKELNKEIKAVIKKEKQRAIHLKLKDSSPKGFWHCVNGLLGRKNIASEVPIVAGGNYVHPEEKPELFAEFFQKKVNDLLALNSLDCNFIHSDSNEGIQFTEEEIITALKTFKPKRSAGPDDIPLLIIKLGISVLMKPIYRLFTLVGQSKKLPVEWKTARIKPIHKKGSKLEIGNYRPISNLNSVSKLFERCLLNRLSDVDDGVNQHGFKSNHSTVTAAIDIQTEVCKQLDRNRKCLIYSVDLTAAFDLIRPELFVKKMTGKIQAPILDCLNNFLQNRKAFVELEGHCSSMFSFCAGCPQGSTLGPRIFSLYCADLTEHIGEFTVSYADDTYVVLSADTEGELLQKAAITIQKHVEWLRVNGMVCNIQKTELLFFGATHSIDVMVNNVLITSTPTMKVLGLLFDAGMTWDNQVNQAVAKTTKMLHGLNHLRNVLSMRQLRQVTTSLLYSVLFYGCEIWLHKHLSFYLKRKVRSVHYKALRIIYGKNRSRDELDQMSERATPDEWSDFVVAKQFINIVRTGQPRRLYSDLISQSFIERRSPNMLLVYDTSLKKIGCQAFPNRLNVISRCIKFPWLSSISKDQIRINLKKTFFGYARSGNT